MKRLKFPSARVTPGAATCPDWLQGAARQEWQRLAPTLERMGTLDAVSATVFATYCELAGAFERAAAEIHEVGYEAAVASGLWRVQLDASRELLAYEEALLLTPASRAKAERSEQGQGA